MKPTRAVIGQLWFGSDWLGGGRTTSEGNTAAIKQKHAGLMCVKKNPAAVS